MSNRTSPVRLHAREMDWLRTLPDPATKALRRSSTARGYRAGELVFSPSRNPTHVYVLEDGVVRLFRLTPTGAEFTLRYVRPGELFGEMSVVSDRPREGFAQARVASKILHIPRTAFVATLRAYNPVIYSVAKKIAGQVIDFQSRAEDLVFLDARRRLARFLLNVAKEYGQRDGEGVTVRLSLTHAEIASVLGTSRQTVTLHLAELSSAGLIMRRARQLEVPSVARLEAVARPPLRVVV
jgi:CRP/FNR family cyclic AMP-dependent transcriptional regulator